MKKQSIEKVSKKITPGGLRPWQPAFWDAMIGKCPGKDDAGAPGSRLTPEALWDMACLYFQGENEDTMIKKDFIRSGEAAGKVIEMTTTRPFSWTSFELFCMYKGITTSLNGIRTNRDGRYEEFKEVIAQIDKIIYQQKFDGAAIGGYNPQLIIRDLGLADKVDAKVQQEQPLFTDMPSVHQEDAGSSDPSDPIEDLS